MGIPISSGCNNRCIGCHVADKIPREDMPFAEILRRARKGGVISLMGGEPTVRRDFPDILERLCLLFPNKEVHVMTNGRRFSNREFGEDVFSRVEIGRLRVYVNFYSHLPEVHNSITRVKVSHAQTLEGIRNLLDLGVRVVLRTLVNRLNYSKLEKTAEFVCGELRGVREHQFLNPMITGRAQEHLDVFMLRFSEVIPHVASAIDILRSCGIKGSVRHFPYCVLPEGIPRETQLPIPKDYGLVVQLKECKRCPLWNLCPGPQKAYVEAYGEGEFRAVDKNNK